MLSSPTAWQSQYRGLTVDMDDMKVSECGESFMTLMLTITGKKATCVYSVFESSAFCCVISCRCYNVPFVFGVERYKPLPYPVHRLKFLDLQLELLDDFRIRMLQIKNEENNNPLGHGYCAILNTINYIVDVLKDWSEVVVSVHELQ